MSRTIPGLPLLSSASVNDLLVVRNTGTATDRRIPLSGIVPSMTITQLKALTEPVNGQVAIVTETGRAGTFVFDSSGTGAENNGTTFTATDSTPGLWRRRYGGPVDVRWFGAVGDGVADDTVAVQAAVTAAGANSLLYFPEGDYRLTSTVFLPTQLGITGANKFGTTISGNFNGPLFGASIQLWRNTIEKLKLINENAGSDTACFAATGFQLTFRECRFEAPDGYGIRLFGGDYSVENEIRQNFFVRCKYAIHAATGTHSNTDAFVIDNYFFGDGIQVNGIYWDNPSGSTFRGNHFYGGALRYFMELIAGLNVSVSDSFFESDTNPRIRLTGGNPCSYSFFGNKFWRGNGSLTDFNGDQESIIALSFNLGNPCRLTFSANVFETGTNSVPIFNLLNGTFASVTNIKVEFDRSNVLNGSYALAISGASGTNTNLHLVASDHPEFWHFSTAQSVSPSAVSCSEFFQKSSGFATGFPTLPTDKAWLSNRRLRVNNISTDHTISFSTSATGGISGNKASDANQIAPRGVADLLLVDGNYYILHLKT